MPINIYNESSRETVAWLCDDDWRLPIQIETLESWLLENHNSLKDGEFVADIGFCWRHDASGGGSALSPETLKIMADHKIHLYLSEYPGFYDEQEDV